MTNHYAAAVAKRQSLIEKIERLQAELKEYEVFFAVLARVDPSISAQTPPAKVIKRRHRCMPQAEFNKRTEALLRGRGERMQAAEIAEALREIGHPVGGANEVHTVRGKIARSDGRFFLIRGPGCWLTGVPLPQASRGSQAELETMLNG